MFISTPSSGVVCFYKVHFQKPAKDWNEKNPQLKMLLTSWLIKTRKKQEKKTD